MGQATTPGSRCSLPRSTGQEAPAARSTAMKSQKMISIGRPIHTQGTLLSPEPWTQLLLVFQPQCDWQLIHRGPQAVFKSRQFLLKECGAKSRVPGTFMGWEKSHLPGAPQMSPCHNWPPNYGPPSEAAPSDSHVRLSGHRATDKTEKSPA